MSEQRGSKAQHPGDAYFAGCFSPRVPYERGTLALPSVGRRTRPNFLILKCRSLVFLLPGFEKASAENKMMGSSLGCIGLPFRAPDRGTYRDVYPQFQLL